MADLNGVARDLGLNVGIDDATRRRSFNNVQMPKKLAEDVYRPPAPKKAQGGGKKSESGLPRIGGSVMVGGTRIDLPPAQSKTQAPPRNYTPPPPQKSGTGSAGAASISMLGGKKKPASKTGNGRYQD